MQFTFTIFVAVVMMRCVAFNLPRRINNVGQAIFRSTMREVPTQESLLANSMIGAILPGDRTVKFKRFEIPVPGHGEVLIETKASTICGSDIRCIFREYIGSDQEAYQAGTICGHEPAGVIKQIGPGTRKFKVGDRVVVYHVSGCGVCKDCRMGYMISCQDDNYRKSYGFQRNGGMAPFMLADEKDLIALPDELTMTDGAQIACGFGTVYEGLSRVGVSGTDAVLVMGLGPVGLATLQLARAMGARQLIGIDTMQERVDLAKDLGLADYVLLAGTSDNVKQVLDLTNGKGCERTVDCTGNHIARSICLDACSQWGKILFLGEGGVAAFDVSHALLHKQRTITGSWVTSIWRMEELVERIAQWGIHPEDLVTHRYMLEDAEEAYLKMDARTTGKVAVVFDKDELLHRTERQLDGSELDSYNRNKTLSTKSKDAFDDLMKRFV